MVPLENGQSLPECVLISSAMITLTRGTAYVPVVNVGETDVTLLPRHPIGVLGQAQRASFTTQSPYCST